MSTNEFENYLALLVRLMPVDRSEREAIRDELRSHLEDRFEDLLAQKVPRDEALHRAIDELGDAARLAAAFVSLTRLQRRRQIMRYSSATIVVGVLALLALTAFWPFDPAVQQASVVPLAPAVVQAQTEGSSAPLEDPFNPDQSKLLSIEQKLDRTIDADFVETPKAQVLDYLAELLDVQIHVNRKNLADSGIDLGEAIDLNLKNIKARTILKLVLENASPEVDFVERDGFLYVSTVNDLDRLTEVRVYNCRDLLSLAPPTATGDFGAMPGGALMASGMSDYAEGGSMTMAGGAGGEQGPLTPAKKLKDLIQASVESESWDDVGGDGSISEFNGLLVIKQSARVHEKVKNLLGMLRQAADTRVQSQQAR